MPRVKTISPGRLTGISGLTREASRQVGRQKDIEYATELSDWKAEKTKLEGIKQEQLNYLDQKMKMIAGEEQAGGQTFDEGFKKAQMQQAKEYASIVSDIKLGNIDPGDGYAKLAVFDQSLKNIETAIPNINALYNRLEEAKSKKDGEVGAFIYDGSGKTFEIVNLINDMYSPTKNGNVSTFIENGKTFLVHKDGQKISIEGLNAIMSGENPDYPINFVQDPTDDLRAVHDAMMKQNDSMFKINYNTEKLDSKGRKVTTKQEKYYIGDNSNYMTYLNRAVDPILNDNEKMKSYWPTIGEGVWTNSDDQREQAQKALVKKGRNLFSPKNDVISKDIDLPKSNEENIENKVKVVSYDTIINDATALKKSLDNPNIDPKTKKRITKEQIEAGEFERLSKEEKDNKQKLTDDLKYRFGGSGFATGSGTKIIQDIEIKYKDGELLFFPQVNYAAAGSDEDLKTLKEYSSGVPLTNERLLKFEKQLKEIAKESVVSTGVGAKFN